MERQERFLCPYCLREGVAPLPKEESRRRYFTCSACSARIPFEYMERRGAPVEIIAAIGPRGHGKSVYLASLFNALDELASYWPGFYTFAADEKSLDTIRESARQLKGGELPPPTQASFPGPTILELRRVPLWGARILLFYDVGGDAFTRANSILMQASFTRLARTVMFVVSLDELEGNYSRMHDLISIYTYSLAELGGSPEQQDLLVVLSKGDRLRSRLASHGEIWDYLTSGSLDTLGTDLSGYLDRMNAVSASLAQLLAEQGAAQFLNFASDRFRSVQFSMVSALGSEPAAGGLQIEARPKRVLDPLLWILRNEGTVDAAGKGEDKHEWVQVLRSRFSKRDRGNADAPPPDKGGEGAAARPGR